MRVDAHVEYTSLLVFIQCLRAKSRSSCTLLDLPTTYWCGMNGMLSVAHIDSRQGESSGSCQVSKSFSDIFSVSHRRCSTNAQKLFKSRAIQSAIAFSAFSAFCASLSDVFDAEADDSCTRLGRIWSIFLASASASFPGLSVFSVFSCKQLAASSYCSSSWRLLSHQKHGFSWRWEA